MPRLNLLRDLIERVPARLEQLPQNKAETKSSPTAWSPKEELGHLLDSAVNNHQRIVRAQSEDKLAMPGYEQNRWVAINRYQHRDWKELIEVWQALNRQLLAAAESVPDSAWSHTLTVAASQPMTLEFVFDDYVTHMLHHLEHIGLEVHDIKPNTTHAA
ncbi:MAG: DinB family protein [Terriglobales bacterium]|jgi:DinB family protein